MQFFDTTKILHSKSVIFMLNNIFSGDFDGCFNDFLQPNLEN